MTAIAISTAATLVSSRFRPRLMKMNETSRMIVTRLARNRFVATEFTPFVVDADSRRYRYINKSTTSRDCVYEPLRSMVPSSLSSLPKNCGIAAAAFDTFWTGVEWTRRWHSDGCIGNTATTYNYHTTLTMRRLFSTTPLFISSHHNSTSSDENCPNILPSFETSESGLSTSWMQMYDLLVEYHKEHRSTIVPDRCDNEMWVKVQKWVRIQRQQSRRLSSKQKRLLNQLDFVWDQKEAGWLEKYERLCDYESKMPLEMSATEISNISSSDLESVFENRYQKDPVLRRWVNAQRQKYRRETISMERVWLLEKVEGFVWDVKEARWFEMHRRLSLFAEKHNGSCIVPQHYAEDPQLACWVSNQRHRKHQLSSERIQMLDALGFVWDVREFQWMGNYEKYKAVFFAGEEQKFSREEQQQMNDWAVKQRRNYRNGSLSPYRIQLLNNLVHPIDGSGFAWDPQEQNWMEMYNELKEFRKIHNHVMVPTRTTRFDGSIVDDDIHDDSESSSSSSSSSSSRQLGIWVANQRRNFKKEILSKERHKLLNDIDFVWDAPEAMWNDQFQRLLDYQKNHIEEGKERSVSTVVPQHYQKDPQLAIWVKEQRQNRKNGILTAERLESLERIGFVWDALSPSSPEP